MNHIHYSGLCAKSFNRTHHVLWPISRGKMTKELLSIRCGDKSVCLVCCLCIWPHSKIKGRERECFLHSVAGYLQYTALFHFICLLYKKKKVYHRGWRYFSESSTVIQTAPHTPSTWMLSQKSKIDNIICAFSTMMAHKHIKSQYVPTSTAEPGREKQILQMNKLLSL